MNKAILEFSVYFVYNNQKCNFAIKFDVTVYLNAGVAMSRIELRRVTESCEMDEFNCGNSSIEQQIKYAYYSSLLQAGYAYEVVLNNKIVGYYMITLTTLHSSNLPPDLQQYYAIDNQRFPAVEIVYLAIRKDFQNRRIGTNVLKTIIKIIRNWCNQIPIRFIVLDALKEKMPWYEQHGFFAIEKPETDKPTVKMFLDCIIDREKLESYIESYIERRG